MLDESFHVPTNCLHLKIPNCRSCICRRFLHFDGVSYACVSNILIETPFGKAYICTQFCVECTFFDSMACHCGAFEFFQEQYCMLNYFAAHSIAVQTPLNHHNIEFAVNTPCTALFALSVNKPNNNNNTINTFLIQFI